MCSLTKMGEMRPRQVVGYSIFKAALNRYVGCASGWGCREPSVAGSGGGVGSGMGAHADGRGAGWLLWALRGA